MERKSKTLTIILSFVAAVCLWVYVLTIVNPPTTVTIRTLPVNVIGTQALKDRGYAIADMQSYSVDINITGSRNDVESALSSRNFSVIADVSQLNPGSNVVTVDVDAPKGITVNDITSQYITLNIEEFVTESRNTKVFFSDPGPGYEETIVKQETNTIDISGAASDVKKVSYIKCNLPSDILIRDEIRTVALTGVPVDAQGNEIKNVSLDRPGIELDAIIHTVKNVQFNVVLEGESLYGPDGIESFDAPTAITIKGTSYDIAAVNSVLSKVINIEGVAADATYAITADLPKGILLSRTQRAMTGSLKISEEAKAAYEAAQAEGPDDQSTEIH